MDQTPLDKKAGLNKFRDLEKLREEQRKQQEEEQEAEKKRKGAYSGEQLSSSLHDDLVAAPGSVSAGGQHRRRGMGVSECSGQELGWMAYSGEHRISLEQHKRTGQWNRWVKSFILGSRF